MSAVPAPDAANSWAVDVVARHLVAELVATHAGDAWEMYPDIGEHDWTRVVGRAKELAVHPDPGHYQDAYAVLEAQANTPAPTEGAAR